MNSSRNFIILLILLLINWSCEDVVDVELDTVPPKLVIEATGIQVENQTEGFLSIRLTKTVPYFEDYIPKVNGAQITVEVENQLYEIPEVSEGSNIYQNLIPMIEGEDYTLTIHTEGEEYQGTTRLYTAVPFEFVEQDNDAFDPDFISTKAYFTDPGDEENYYLIEFYSDKNGRVLDNVDDKLFNGNQVSTYYADEFDPGDSLRIRINGISGRFNTYFSILSSQNGEISGNPFSTAPTTLRGNMINTNDPDQFPLGYFRISQQFETHYIFQ